MEFWNDVGGIKHGQSNKQIYFSTLKGCLPSKVGAGTHKTPREPKSYRCPLTYGIVNGPSGNTPTRASEP